MSGFDERFPPWDARYGADHAAEYSDAERMSELYREHLQLWRIAQRANPTIALTAPAPHGEQDDLEQYRKALEDWRRDELEARELEPAIAPERA